MYLELPRSQGQCVQRDFIQWIFLTSIHISTFAECFHWDSRVKRLHLLSATSDSVQGIFIPHTLDQISPSREGSFSGQMHFPSRSAIFLPLESLSLSSRIHQKILKLN
uniref:Uncharacterized protein n=1 Tax=Lepeophtheirus salmonis TaxID=72036 RepID=A0A0K2TAQ7_LEPSM